VRLVVDVVAKTVRVLGRLDQCARRTTRFTVEFIPRRRQVTVMTQPFDDARLEEVGFVDELTPTTSAIVILGYN
jgi:hypothetical protein